MMEANHNLRHFQADSELSPEEAQACADLADAMHWRVPTPQPPGGGGEGGDADTGNGAKSQQVPILQSGVFASDTFFRASQWLAGGAVVALLGALSGAVTKDTPTPPPTDVRENVFTRGRVIAARSPEPAPQRSESPAKPRLAGGRAQPGLSHHKTSAERPPEPGKPPSLADADDGALTRPVQDNSGAPPGADADLGNPLGATDGNGGRATAAAANGSTTQWRGQSCSLGSGAPKLRTMSVNNCSVTVNGKRYDVAKGGSIFGPLPDGDFARRNSICAVAAAMALKCKRK